MKKLKGERNEERRNFRRVSFSRIHKKMPSCVILVCRDTLAFHEENQKSDLHDLYRDKQSKTTYFVFLLFFCGIVGGASYQLDPSVWRSLEKKIVRRDTSKHIGPIALKAFCGCGLGY